MKMFKILLTATVALSAGDMSIDIAKEQEKIVKKVFNLYDSDSNGKLDIKEFTKFSLESNRRRMLSKVEEIISTCDKNKNGTIEVSEKVSGKEIEKLESSEDKRGYIERNCLILTEFFEKMDMDHNNKLTKDELLNFSLKQRYKYIRKQTPIGKKFDKMREERMKRIFIRNLKRCDSNKDGNITLIELTSSKCGMRSEFFLQQTKDINGSFSLKNIKVDNKLHKEPKPYENFMLFCDANRDDKITLVEATSEKCFMPYISSEEFLKIDSNKDGYLTQKEISKAQDKQKEKNTPKAKFNKNYPKKIPKFIIMHEIATLCNIDKNDYIDKKEAIECEVPLKLFNALDTDKNSVLNDDDYKQIMINGNFERKDLNKDKMIDFKEFKRGFSGQCSAF